MIDYDELRKDTEQQTEEPQQPEDPQQGQDPLRETEKGKIVKKVRNFSCVRVLL